MTDPRDSERDLDRAIARIIETAGADAPDPPDSSTFVRELAVTSTPSGRQRLVMAAALVLIVGVGAGMLLFVDRDDGDETGLVPVDSAPNSTELESDTTAATTPPTSAPETSRPPSTTTSSTGEAPRTAPASVTRPVTDPSVCVPDSARDRFTEGLTLFARRSSNPVPVQIVADPDERLVGPFAVVQRFFGDGRTPGFGEQVAIGDTTFWITLTENGYGAVEWDVGDGSLGSVRSRGLDRNELLDVLGALSPRDPTDEVPGFDVAMVDGLELLHEQLNTDIDGEVGSSQCDVASTGYRYRISAINGDSVFQYGGVIDRPVPLEVGMRGETLIVIDGVADPSAPTVDDVVEADPDAWLELRSRPQWPEEEDGRTESIGEGAEVVVALLSVDGTTDEGYLTLRLRTQDGIAFLEVDTAEAVLASDAAFWRTEVDPGTGGMSIARVGSTLGYRVGDAPLREPFEVTVSVIDGGEFVLQSTGPITLMPI
jgi:hypothetical protein